MVDGMWLGVYPMHPRRYTCGYCGRTVASDRGLRHESNMAPKQFRWMYVCPNCEAPTYFDRSDTQVPGAVFGEYVRDIPDPQIDALYAEARQCISANAFTASVLCCRKLLMHIAVSVGAPEKKNFLEYVNYLNDQHYIPPGAKIWVDHIRTKSNEANHEIALMEEDDAKDLVSFVAMLLKQIYEFPAAAQRRGATP
jgi:Domain of unknown function (DUF4145)